MCHHMLVTHIMYRIHIHIPHSKIEFVCACVRACVCVQCAVQRRVSFFFRAFDILIAPLTVHLSVRPFCNLLVRSCIRSFQPINPSSDRILTLICFAMFDFDFNVFFEPDLSMCWNDFSLSLFLSFCLSWVSFHLIAHIAELFSFRYTYCARYIIFSLLIMSFMLHAGSMTFSACGRSNKNKIIGDTKNGNKNIITHNAKTARKRERVQKWFFFWKKATNDSNSPKQNCNKKETYACGESKWACPMKSLWMRERALTWMDVVIA